MNRITRIKQKLGVLKPHHLEIVDDTPKHAGHIENQIQLETHLTIFIAAESLKENSRVSQHRIIKELIGDEFDQGLHALSIKILNEK